MAINRFQQQQRQARLARQTGARQAGGSFRNGATTTPTRQVSARPSGTRFQQDVQAFQQIQDNNQPAGSPRFGAIARKFAGQQIGGSEFNFTPRFAPIPTGPAGVTTGAIEAPSAPAQTEEEIGQVLQQAGGKALSPTEFERLREATGATEDNFDQFFERIGGDIFAKSEGLTGQAPLSPSEFESLRKNLGVGQDNFDEFFRREGKDIFFQRSNLAGQPGEVFNAATSGGASVFDSSTLTIPEATFPEFDENNITDPIAWIRSLADVWEATKTDFQKQLEQQQQTLFDQTQKQIDEIGNIAQQRRDLFADFKVQEQVEQIGELNLMIQQKTAEFEQGMFNVENQTVAAPFIVGQQEQLSRQKAIELGALNGTMQAMTGNLTLANDIIDSTINFEFSALEAQMAATANFIDLNRDQMSGEEKKQAFVIENILAERQRIIDEQKAEKETIKNLMISLAEIGGDPRLIDFNAPLNENMQIYADAVERFNVEERAHEIQQARALAQKTLITDASGKPVGTFNPLTGETISIGSGNYVQSIGAITGYGSPLWEHGLDIDLAVGDEVYTPVTGVVTDVLSEEESGGFGNQVKMVDEQGNELWFSHLQAPGVVEGQEVTAGMFLATGGNTGNTIPGAGGDGSHLDVTIVKPDGTFMTPHEVEGYVNGQAATQIAPQPGDNIFNEFFTSPTGPEGGGDLSDTEKKVIREQEAKDFKTLDNATNALRVVELLENHEAFGVSVGLKGPSGGLIGDILPFVESDPITGTKAADFVAELERLKAILSADKIEILRGLGSMSEKELKIVTDSATSLNRNMSEEAFRTELARLRKVMTDVQQRLSTGEVVSETGGDSLDSFLDNL